MRRMLRGCLLLGFLPALAAADDDAAFFESSVRPILVERCQKCHNGEKHKNGLRLDSRAALLAGGISGPALVPGKPDESLLIDAVHHDGIEMPPEGKLPDAEIAALTQWVERGAPWPGGAAGPVVKPFDLAERKQHWSFQPVRAVEPPPVADAAWVRNPIDRFLLAALEAKGFKPAADADRRSLIRRLTFDLTGLPPTPGDVETFVNDRDGDAYDKVVERLLASPHYGERWARHWLDLVRFAETSGHEFDYDIPDAWRYRDYVIRAFDRDLPYDQFVTEQIAGDLLPTPRRHPVEDINESVLGTGFYFLGEGTHSPVDVREDGVARIDNQIDVLSKTFLGLTVSCARCHDHKFDAISTRDYYALVGYLRSSRPHHAFIDPPGRIAAKAAEITRFKRHILAERGGESRGSEASAYLLAASATRLGRVGTPRDFDPGRLARWSAALSEPSAQAPASPLYAWERLAIRSEEPLARRAEALRSTAPPADDSELFESFDRPDWGGWFAAGDAFGSGPSRSGDWRPSSAGEIVPVVPGQAHSGLVSDRLQGVLRSPTFTIRRGKIHLLASGRGGRVNLVVDGFEKVRAPIYGGLTIGIDSPVPRWHTIDVSMWAGHRAYIEIADGAAVNYTGGQSAYWPGDGWIAVDEIRLGDGGPPTTTAPDFAAEILAEAPTSLDALADRYERWIDGLAADWLAGRTLSPPQVAALAFLAARGLVELPRPATEELDRLRAIEAAIPEPRLAPAIADGDGEDEHVLIRGNYRTPGDVVPRRFLEAFGGLDPTSPESGSGRLDLARRIASAENPLTARVLVNRLWLHHFGVGLVPTPDDFGVMGQPPSHPELLDWLAREFVASGWSIKHMHRMIVRAHAYQMASTPDPDADQADPDNRLLHRARVRRLEAEAIRDAMLAVSGRLDPTRLGPSVPPHLTPFMEGRGRPGRSGPLDGDGRRSLYINVRRNFLTPMFLAFDAPIPFTTIGRRNASNVPAQALTLLNDPFVVGQARRWADRLRAEAPDDATGRVDWLYRTAFGRPPTADESAAARAFVGDGDDWAGLCHVLFNVKEFIFIN